METAASMMIGYLLGCISPAAIVAKIKKTDVRRQGTGNLGATNTMLAFGRGLGILVMLLDVFKAFFAVRLAQFIFPQLGVAGVLSGCAAVFGHIFPFYMRFKGGRGYAALGGMALGVSPLLFCLFFVFGVLVMVAVNHGVAMPIVTAAVFPLVFGVYTRDTDASLIVGAACLLVVFTNLDGLKKALYGEVERARDVLRDHLLKLKSPR